jgi:hypothetical protein
MAKFIRINDNLSINIDSIYSIASEATNELENIEDIQKFKNKAERFKEELKVNLPELEIKPGILYKPDKDGIIEEYYDSYLEKLQIYITSTLGEEPDYVYKTNYYLYLVNGTKVNIDKIIYNKLMELVEE